MCTNNAPIGIADFFPIRADISKFFLMRADICKCVQRDVQDTSMFVTDEKICNKHV